jgi:5-methylcytosine-specific restriction endonuclease McrA
LLGNRTRLFQIRDGGGKMVVGYKDVLEKFGINPVCYLTGRPIDFNFPESYNLDHVIPRAKGGDNTLSNMNIACRAANMAKNDLLVSEFLELCEEVLLHHGYQVRRPITPP